MKNFKVVGILIKDRIKEAGRTQKILTDFAHIIETRIGKHEVSDSSCSRVGIIVLHLTGNTAEWKKFEEALSVIGGIEVQTISFDY